MCGIAGYIDFSQKLKMNNLVDMTTALEHRGPDGYGHECYKLKKANIGFGHRRLSILDLSVSGKQPMTKHGLRITYNGEFYNYKDVRQELIDLGYAFVSDSDTEVILSAFNQWGTEAVHKFIGMFAFAIYHELEEKIYFFRDRAGVKPLYYYWDGHLFLFASELKAFHEIPGFIKQLNLSSVANYFQYGYISTPNCIFQNCYKLDQGHYLTFDVKKRSFIKEKYWSVFDYVNKGNIKISESDCIKETENLLSSACNYRMVSDVPVGIFLSGGYDSSLVTALIQKEQTERVKTFTIGFEDEKFNEAEHASLVAKHLQTNHQELTCTRDEAKRVLPLLANICDEPFGDSSIIPTYLVSKMASKYVTVALSSDGGDEQFIGYSRYMNAIKLGSTINKFPKIINRSIAAIGGTVAANTRIKRKVWESFKESSISAIPQIQTQTLFASEVNELIIHSHIDLALGNFSESSNLNTLFAVEYQNYLQDDIMVKIDRAAMAVSLEGREPLLDHRLAEWAMQLPVGLKYKNGTLKYLLKKITHKYIPKELVDRPKQGFGIPINKWLRSDFKELLMDCFDEEFLEEQGLFSTKYLSNRLSLFLSGKDNSAFVWYFVMFQLWYKRWCQPI